MSDLRDGLHRHISLLALSLLLIASTSLAIRSVHETDEEPGRVVNWMAEVDEISVVFIASSNCGALVQYPEVVPSFSAAVDSVRARYERTGSVRVSSIGISVDNRAGDGIRFLSEVYDFDEVSAGRNWMNNGATRYLWKELTGEAAIPQILVTARRITMDPTVDPGEEMLIKRVVGAPAILRWRDQGWVLPSSRFPWVASAFR